MTGDLNRIDNKYGNHLVKELKENKSRHYFTGFIAAGRVKKLPGQLADVRRCYNVGSDEISDFKIGNIIDFQELLFSRPVSGFDLALLREVSKK